MSEWICVCLLPSGAYEVTEWITQDGADQMASETESHWRRRRKKCVCQVAPGNTAQDAMAVCQIIAETEGDQP